jgi:O-succinylbenzoate synthase
MMFEQPLAHDDIFDHAKLATSDSNTDLSRRVDRSPETRECDLDGRLQDHQRQTRPRRRTQRSKTARTVAREREIPVWCGGMLESAIGRAHNIAMSTLAGFHASGDVSRQRALLEEDVIEPAGDRQSARHESLLPDAPGIGFKVNLRRLDALTVRRPQSHITFMSANPTSFSAARQNHELTLKARQAEIEAFISAL